jgi:carbonyl reductase 1
MKKIAAVTGANTGLGFSLVKKLCRLLGDNSTVYLTARDEVKGKEAIKQLNEIGLSPQFHLLDVTSEKSIDTFSNYIKNNYGGIDILFHNAAARISPLLSKHEQIQNFINTNNFGTSRIITSFQPLLRDNSRFVTVASGFGSLNHLNKSLHDKFDVTCQTVDGINTVMQNYIEQVQSGTDVQSGWPDWMNIPSKIAQVAVTKIAARDMLMQNAKEKNIMIMAVCPGLMDTEASRPWFKDMSRAKKPDEAADDVLWLVNQNEWNSALYGNLIQYKKEILWLNE